MLVCREAQLWLAGGCAAAVQQRLGCSGAQEPAGAPGGAEQLWGLQHCPELYARQVWGWGKLVGDLGRLHGG